MYGLKPEDIKYLLPLRGKMLTQICVGEHDVQFNFHPDGNVSLGGRCELLEPDGAIADVWEDGRRTDKFPLFFGLLGKSVDQVEIETHRSFVAVFSNAWKIRVVDNSEQFESFSVGGLYV